MCTSLILNYVTFILNPRIVFDNSRLTISYVTARISVNFLSSLLLNFKGQILVAKISFLAL